MRQWVIGNSKIAKSRSILRFQSQPKFRNFGHPKCPICHQQARPPVSQNGLRPYTSRRRSETFWRSDYDLPAVNQHQICQNWHKMCQFDHLPLYGFIESREIMFLILSLKISTLQIGVCTFLTKNVQKVPCRVYQWVPYTRGRLMSTILA